MWQWLEYLLYGTNAVSTPVVPPPPVQEVAQSSRRSSQVFDSHIMTEAASGKNPQAVSLAWDEGRAFGYQVAPQNWMGMTPRERKETLLSIFLANPWASNCIDTIGLYITSGGYTIEPRVEKPDERQRDEIEAFLRRVNEDWDFNQYVYDQITDEDIFGECFTEFTLKNSKPYQLFPIDCLTMDTEHDRYGRVIKYKQQLTSTSVVNELDPKAIIRWWNPHKRAKVDPFSPLERVQDAVLLDKKMTNWTTTFFQKGAKFPYTIEGLGDQDEADRYLTWHRANYTGEKNAQTPIATWGTAKIVPGGKGSIDIDFDKGLDRMQTIVLSAFHVPPSIACIAESGNRLTDMSDGQRKILEYIACDPRRHRFFEKFNYRLIHPYFGSDYYVSSRYADFRADADLAKMQDTRIRNGSVTINETRQEMGKKPYEKGGDTALFAVAREVLPVERLDEMAEEQRETAQVSLDTAKATADLTQTKAKQAKEPPEPAPLQKVQQNSAQNGTKPPAQKDEKQESFLQQNTGMMLALLLDPHVASQLAIPGGEPAEDLHITLAYLGDMEEDPDDGLYRPHTTPGAIWRPIHSVASTTQPLTGKVGGIGRFYPAETETTPVIALVDIPGLAEFRTELVEALKQASYFVAENHGYTPHVTLAYVDQNAPMPVEQIPPLPLRFDTVWLCVGNERIPFRLGQEDEEKETYTQGHETDDVTQGTDQDQGNGSLHPVHEQSTDEGSRSTTESSSVVARHKAELASWIAAPFQTMRARGSALSPTRATAVDAYAFTEEEQAELASTLAKAKQIALQFAYQRDMAAVGITRAIAHQFAYGRDIETVGLARAEEGIRDRVSDALAWGREQVASIIATLREMLNAFIGGLSADADVPEEVDGWIDDYGSYKSEQITNVVWGTGANEGSREAIQDLLDMLTRMGADMPADIGTIADGSLIRVRVMPETSSSDWCREWAGKSVPLAEADSLPFFPAHINCIHGIEVYIEGGDNG